MNERNERNDGDDDDDMDVLVEQVIFEMNI
jgi:hypothetical protein